MVYIYDILLNFNENLIEFFEWEEFDNIKYVKKIALFKTNTLFINDLIKNQIKLEDEFIDKVPKYEMNGIKDTYCACLVTDGKIAIAILIENKKIISVSRLLLDEEEEVLEMASNLDEVSVNYEVIKTKKMVKNLLTRKEENIKNNLIKEIDKLYKNKNYDKLFYLYYEYSNRESHDVNYVYNYLINSLNNFDIKHKYLFDILLMSNASFSEN